MVAPNTVLFLKNRNIVRYFNAITTYHGAHHGTNLL